MADVYIPEHMLHQIFLLMPTKPLLRFKCLSKQCNRLISDPKFMKLRSRRMIFLPSLPFHAIDNTVTGHDTEMIKLCFPLKNLERYRKIIVVGSFNGIVLLVIRWRKMINNRYDHDMILYNPFSGEFKTVPDRPLFNLKYYYHIYGFGYGATTNDLKIIRLREFIVRRGSISYEIFDLKTWSWSMPSKLIGDYSLGIYSGTFANGFLYWDAERRQTCWPKLILVLDIKKMVFSDIEIPEGCRLKRLGTYNGRLCMICSQENVEGYVLLVVHEVGFGKSWSRVCSFKPVPLMAILCVLDDGKLLVLKSSKQRVIYDMFKDSYKEVNALTSFVSVGRLQSIEYVESSISPSDICSISI